jgi:hypothetical protein
MTDFHLILRLGIPLSVFPIIFSLFSVYTKFSPRKYLDKREQTQGLAFQAGKSCVKSILIQLSFPLIIIPVHVFQVVECILSAGLRVTESHAARHSVNTLQLETHAAKILHNL